MYDRTTISVWARTRNKLKLLAAKLGVTMAEAADRAISKLLETAEQAPSPESPKEDKHGN
jgi:hypothetical protein